MTWPDVDFEKKQLKVTPKKEQIKHSKIISLLPDETSDEVRGLK